MNHRRYAHTYRAGAALLATGAAYNSHQGAAIPSVGLVYGALLLAWCGHREAAFDRRARVDAHRAKHADRPAPPPPPPCCSFWQHSDGAIHGPDCRRPAAARTLRDGAPLDAHERAVIADIEAHYDDRSAA